MMNHRQDPLDDVIAEFRGIPVPERPPDERVLARLVHPGEEPGPTASLLTSFIRRFPMLPVLGYPTAAAVLLVISGWFALAPASPPALAEVIQATEKHKLLRFQSKGTTEDRVTGGGPASGTRTVYVDIVEPRVREEERGKTLNDVLEYKYAAVYDYRRDRFLVTLSQELIVTKEQAKDEPQAQAVRMVEKGGLAKKEATLSRIAWTKTDNIPPMSLLGKNRGFLDSLRDLQASKNTLSTRAELDGRQVAKYRLKDGNRTMSLWVDPQTKLPIRVEIEMIDPTPRIARNEWVYTDFEWDPKDADREKLFSTDPPAGYVVEDHTNEP
jgi:hypothetical protein